MGRAFRVGIPPLIGWLWANSIVRRVSVTKLLLSTSIRFTACAQLEVTILHLDGSLAAAAAAAKSLQSCPTLCDPIDGSPSGSTVPGILQARTLEWVAISFSNAWKVKGKSLSLVRLLATPRTAAYQAPPSMGFSRQEYWSGVPLPSQFWYNSEIPIKLCSPPFPTPGGTRPGPMGALLFLSAFPHSPE